MSSVVHSIRIALAQRPWPILLFLVVFALVPPMDLTLVPRAEGLPFYLNLVNILALWVIPAAICVTLWKKHHWFFGLYIVECVFLIAIVVLPAFSETATFGRYLLSLSMAYLSFLVGRSNLLYPMMTRNTRFWRRSERYRVGKEAKVVSSDGHLVRSIFIDDCSETGLGISIAEEDIVSFPDYFRPGSNLSVHVYTDSPETAHVIVVQIVWSMLLPTGDRKIGCMSRDRSVTRNYIASETSKKKSVDNIESQDDDTRLEKQVRHAAMVLWLLSAALVLTIP